MQLKRALAGRLKFLVVHYNLCLSILIKCRRQSISMNFWLQIYGYSLDNWIIHFGCPPTYLVVPGKQTTVILCMMSALFLYQLVLLCEVLTISSIQLCLCLPLHSISFIYRSSRLVMCKASLFPWPDHAHSIVPWLPMHLVLLSVPLKQYYEICS